MASGGDLDMNARHSEAKSEDDDEETPTLAWEQPDEPLPEDLGLVLQRFQHHGLQVPAKEVLDCCPKWSGLKAKAEANNYRNDGPYMGMFKNCWGEKMPPSLYVGGGLIPP
jgi:hypothetical protein